MEHEQTTLQDRQKLPRQIEQMLRQLCEPGKADPPVGDYTTGWNRLCEVPEAYYPKLVNILQAELDCRRRLGDGAYFKAKPLAAKVDAYMDALVETQDSFLKEFVRDDDAVSWVEFKLRFAERLKEKMEGAADG